MAEGPEGDPERLRTLGIGIDETIVAAGQRFFLASEEAGRIGAVRGIIPTVGVAIGSVGEPSGSWLMKRPRSGS
jgi:hypothetical protein